MPESEEEKKKRWAAAAAKSYMTPAMAHALNMSKQQSSNKYKEKFDKTKARGYTPVTSTPEIENAKKQSKLISQNKYKSDFEKNKAKFTQVADDPETVRISRVSNQISNIAYHGKGAAVSKSRRRKEVAPSSSNSTASKTHEEKAAKEPASPDAQHENGSETNNVLEEDYNESVEDDTQQRQANGDGEEYGKEFAEDIPSYESTTKISEEEEKEENEQQDDQNNYDNTEQSASGGDYERSPDYTAETQEDNQEDSLGYDNHDEAAQQQEDDRVEGSGSDDVDRPAENNETVEEGNSLDDFYANLE